jgi:pyrroloquinoline quinone biosynthesis protein B
MVYAWEWVAWRGGDLTGFGSGCPTLGMRIQVSLILVFLLTACAAVVEERRHESPVPSSTPSTSLEVPRVRVLGIAQDGGLPHAACRCDRCEAARLDPSRASGVASLAIIDPTQGQGQVFLIDATPDIISQLTLLEDVRDAPLGRVDRTPIDGVLLTHAHMGHYLGLAHLGFEAVSVKGLPVWASQTMVAFLGDNAPWEQLVTTGGIVPKAVAPGQPWPLTERITVQALSVPHRAEYTDTLGYRITGPNKALLYIPDCSPWHVWETPLEEALEGVDVALLDATFYSGDELPGRDLSKIGHPLVVDTMDRLQSQVDAGTLEVWFVHLNHSNPALEPTGDARAEITRRGFGVAYAGLEFKL